MGKNNMCLKLWLYLSQHFFFCSTTNKKKYIQFSSEANEEKYKFILCSSQEQQKIKNSFDTFCVQCVPYCGVLGGVVCASAAYIVLRHTTAVGHYNGNGGENIDAKMVSLQQVCCITSTLCFNINNVARARM